MKSLNIPKFNNLEDYIPFLNQKRRVMLINFVLCVILMSIFYASFFVLVLIGLILFGDIAYLFVIFGFLSMGLAGFFSYLFIRAINKYKAYYFMSLINYFKADYYDELNFNYNKTITKQSIKDLKIFSKYKEVEPGMYYEGKVKGLSFKSSYYEYVSLDKIRVKQGRIVIFDLQKSIETNLLIEHKKTKVLFNKGLFKEKLSLESSYLNDNYNIYTDDNLNCFKILEPIFIKGLSDYSLYYGAQINLLFKDNKLYIAINDYKNRYKYGLVKKVTINDLIDFINEVKMVSNLVSTLNLVKYSLDI